MQNEKLLSMLGLARRAGKLSMGHDTAEKALKTKKARLVLFCSDVSPALRREFHKTAALCGCNAAFGELDVTMDCLYFSLGYRAGVMTLDDENFSKRVIELLKEENAHDN